MDWRWIFLAPACVAVLGGVLYLNTLLTAGARMFAETGETASENYLGTAYLNGWGVPVDQAQGLAWLQKSADQGNRDAQFNLGMLYETGTGPVGESPSKASYYYLLSATNGKVDARIKLGGMYREGRGVHQSYAEAARWYREAADQGNAVGQFNLGTMYEGGLGVKKDALEAAAWYRKAAAQGLEEAKQRYAEGHYDDTARN